MGGEDLALKAGGTKTGGGKLTVNHTGLEGFNGLILVV